MKQITAFCLALLSLFMVSCNFFANEEPLDTDLLTCYIAINKGDTAWLDIDTSNKKINGLFKMSYGGKKIYEGQIKGTINKDTLKAHYDFKVNNVDKWYRNPVSFLRKDDQFLMGVGDIITVWGSGVFNEKVPVNYDKSRFVFAKTVCKY